MLRLFDSAKEGSLSLFIGAGISCDPPASLPLAKQLVNSILWNLCNNHIFSEHEKQIFQSIIDDMRPEILVSILFDILEEETYTPIKLFNCAAPNTNHFSIANLALKEHLACLVTTNFDLALEHALNELGCQWRLFVTEDEFEKWDGSFHPLPLFKLHGSLMEPPKGNKQQTAIEANEVRLTMEQVGKSLPESKAEVLKQLLERTDFLVVGYSGRDDFDIYPLLYNTHSHRQLVWLSHVDYEQDYKIITGEQISCQDHQDNIDRLVAKRGKLGARIFAHTSSRLLSFGEVLDNVFNRDIFDPSEIVSKTRVPSDSVWDKKVREWAYSLKNKIPSLPYLVKGALIGTVRGNELIAIKNFKKSVDLSINTGNSKYEAQSRKFLAIHEGLLERWDDAYKNLTFAIKVAEKINFQKLVMQASNELGVQLGSRGEIDKALEVFQQALLVAPEDSLLLEKGLIWHNMGTAYDRKEDLNKAIECWKKATKYRQECGDVVPKASTLHNLAYAYIRLRQLVQAIECITEGMDTMCRVYGKSPTFYTARIHALLRMIMSQAENDKDFHIPESVERTLMEVTERLNYS